MDYGIYQVKKVGDTYWVEEQLTGKALGFKDIAAVVAFIEQDLKTVEVGMGA